MRPLVPSRSSLAAVVLCGAVAAGVSATVSGREGAPAPPAEPATGEGSASAPTFFGGALPPGLEARAVGPSPTSGLAGHALPAGPISQERPAPTQQVQRPQTPPAECPLVERDVAMGAPMPPHEFYFTRAVYSSYGGGLRGWGRRGRGSWSIDFPKADRQFMVMVDHLVNIDLFPCANAVQLDDPALRRFPFLYALEVGGMGLSQEEVRGLRDYLYAGGFLVIDDFWGTWEWENFEQEIRRVLPGRPIVEIPLDHPVFHTVYDIDEILQVPNRGNGRQGGPTWENGGRTPYVLGIFDDHDRLMVIINYNTDLGDAWEWAEDPFYPLRFSTFAAEMGVNMIVYSMSH